MTYFRFLTCTAVLVFFATISGSAEAGGSSGGWASSGGSSGGYSRGGGLFSNVGARMRARHSASSGGSSGGSWRSSGGSHGSSGGTVSYSSHGSSGGSHGSSGGRVGPLKRLMAKIRARKSSHSHGSSGGSHGSSGGYVSHSSHGSSGGYTTSHGSSGGSSGVVSYSSSVVHSVSLGATSSYESPVVQSKYQSYSSGDSVIQNDTTTVSDGVPLEGSTLEGGSLGTDTAVAEPKLDSAQYESAKPAVENDSAMLTVSVPSKAAKVTVNGHETTSGGTVRQFMSRGLKDGYVYTYVVKVSYEVGGEEKSESKSIKLRPGDSEKLVFDAPVAAKQIEEDVVTVVRIHVPADATVTLAGNATNGSGATRTFRTKQLKAGQQWADYTIRVSTMVNGQMVSKERTVDVKAGSTTELTFEFDDSEIAQR